MYKNLYFLGGVGGFEITKTTALGFNYRKRKKNKDLEDQVEARRLTNSQKTSIFIFITKKLEFLFSFFKRKTSLFC